MTRRRAQLWPQETARPLVTTLQKGAPRQVGSQQLRLPGGQAALLDGACCSLLPTPRPPDSPAASPPDCRSDPAPHLRRHLPVCRTHGAHGLPLPQLEGAARRPRGSSAAPRPCARQVQAALLCRGGMQPSCALSGCLPRPRCCPGPPSCAAGRSCPCTPSPLPTFPPHLPPPPPPPPPPPGADSPKKPPKIPIVVVEPNGEIILGDLEASAHPATRSECPWDPELGCPPPSPSAAPAGAGGRKQRQGGDGMRGAWLCEQPGPSGEAGAGHCVVAVVEAIE